MVKKFFLQVLFFLFFIVSANAQDPEAYNKMYTHIYLSTAQENMNEALRRADSLLSVSATPLFKTKSLMLLATLCQHKQDLDMAIEYGEKASNIISATDDNNWKVRVYGFLASQYRLLKLYSKSKEYSERAIALIPHITSKEAANSTMGLMLQELAYFEMEQKRYKKAIDYIYQSKAYLALVEQNKEVFILQNEQLLGLNFYKLNNYDSAIQHYRQGLKYTTHHPTYYVTGLVYNGMAAILIKKDSLEQAYTFMQKAEKIAAQSQYLQLKNEVYTTAQLYYGRKRLLDSLTATKKVQDTVQNIILEKNAAALNSIYMNLDSKKVHADKLSSRMLAFLIILCVLTIAGVLYFILYKRRQQKQFELFKNIIGVLKERALDRPLLTEQFTAEPGPQSSFRLLGDVTRNSPEEEPDTIAKDAGVAINDEVIQKLLSGLEAFERSHLFLNNDLSLPYLAAHLRTNTKYLSYVINMYKKKDFNNYINDLRIKYIIEKLKTDEEWRRYKISILAKECGFSSHSKFATVFKSFTGLSPSVFIQYLNKNDLPLD